MNCINGWNYIHGWNITVKQNSPHACNHTYGGSTQMNEYEIHESKLTTWMVKFPIWLKFNNMDESDFSFHIHKHPSHLCFSLFITPQQYVPYGWKNWQQRFELMDANDS